MVVKNTLYVCGGWNSVQQFNDVFILDTKTWAWTKAESGSGETWGPPRYTNLTGCAARIDFLAVTLNAEVPFDVTSSFC